MLAVVFPEVALADNCTGTEDTQNCMAAINFVALAASLAAVTVTGAGALAGRSLRGSDVVTTPDLVPEGATPEQKREAKRRHCEEVAEKLRELADEIWRRLNQEDEMYKTLRQRTSLGIEMEAAVRREEERLQKVSDRWTTLEVVVFVGAVVAHFFPPVAAAEATVAGGAAMTRFLSAAGRWLLTTERGLMTVDAALIGHEKFNALKPIGVREIPGVAEGMKVEQFMAEVKRFKDQTDLFVDRWQENITVIDRMIDSYKTLHERWMTECGPSTTVRPPAPFKEWERYYYNNYGDPEGGHLVRDPWTGSYQLSGWRISPPGHRKGTSW